MSLKEILSNLVTKNFPILLNDGNKDWEAGLLLATLPEPHLKRNVYYQPGMYIAEINDAGYLGHVLYKIKQR